MKLLHKLCSIHAPSGNEGALKDFIIEYVEQNSNTWKTKPVIVAADEEIHDAVLLVFGKPRTAVFAHIDSIGYTVRYNNELVPIGSPHAESAAMLVGKDAEGEIKGKLKCEETEEGEKLVLDFNRQVARGTDLVFECDFRETEEYVQSCYMDNRLGVWNALKLAETLEDGVIAFSCYEEHGGGSVSILSKYIYEKYSIKQALISDITWVTDGVFAGKGVAVSLRDRGIPRKKFVDKVLALANASGVPFQLEVEGAGGSDGKEVQASPYPIDWCFIGAPEANVHSPDELVHKRDISSMLNMYIYLMKHL
ncbi:aminopeptidase [Cytophagaceae bacterium ABcell3]|nr:aminopeptidase [Cytophagaceae bacterium ABcell3]